jgi:hypothetical protein
MISPEVEVYEFCKKMYDIKRAGFFRSIQIVLNFFSRFRPTSSTPPFVTDRIRELVDYIRTSGEDFTSFNSIGYREVFLYLHNIEESLAYWFESLKRFGGNNAVLSDLQRNNKKHFTSILAESSSENQAMVRDVERQYMDSYMVQLNRPNTDRDIRWLQANTPQEGMTGYEYGISRGKIPAWTGPIQEYRRGVRTREIVNEYDQEFAKETEQKDMRFARLGLTSMERNNPTITSTIPNRRFASYR